MGRKVRLWVFKGQLYCAVGRVLLVPKTSAPQNQEGSWDHSCLGDPGGRGRRVRKGQPVHRDGQESRRRERMEVEWGMGVRV